MRFFPVLQLAGMGRRRKVLAWDGIGWGQKGPTGLGKKSPTGRGQKGHSIWGQKGSCSPPSCKPPHVQGCRPWSRMPISKLREMGTSG